MRRTSLIHGLSTNHPFLIKTKLTEDIFIFKYDLFDSIIQIIQYFLITLLDLVVKENLKQVARLNGV